MDISSLPKHHAVLLTADDRVTVAEQLWKDFEARSIANRFFNQTVLDIETARDIISWAKTPYDKERVALISFHTSGVPAQNALLKILEEPPLLTKFVLITSNKEALLQTVVSRLYHVEVRRAKNKKEDVLLFLETDPGARMKLPSLVKLLDKKDEEDRKDREGVRNFILDIALLLQEKKVDSLYVTKTLQMASYASDPSASGKSLIEFLSLLLPRIK